MKSNHNSKYISLKGEAKLKCRYNYSYMRKIWFTLRRNVIYVRCRWKKLVLIKFLSKLLDMIWGCLYELYRNELVLLLTRSLYWLPEISPSSWPASKPKDLYSFMQCSFVKIQDVIGYVSEYMLMRPKPTYKATYVYADYLLWYGWKSNYRLPRQIPFPGRYYRCTESEYI
jgi:hypothetical protein